jgi:hypothetical protein
MLSGHRYSNSGGRSASPSGRCAPSPVDKELPAMDRKLDGPRGHDDMGRFQ